MSWSWSHTPEAVFNVMANVRALPDDTLAEIWAEWEAAYNMDSVSDPGFDELAFEDGLARADDIILEGRRDLLVDCIVGCMIDHDVCDNGGFRAWACPFGCDCHTVAFSNEGENDA